MSLFHRAFHLAHFIFPGGGTCLEFGVFRGSTYLYQAQQILANYPDTRLIGFDSWKGLPEESKNVWAPERHAPSEYAAPKREVLAKLARLGVEPRDARFRLIDGFYSDSLTAGLQRDIHNVVFINVDVDIHRSTIEVLDFVRPLLRPGVVIYWDDWKEPGDENAEAWGEQLAWSQWYPKQDLLRVETIEVDAISRRSMLVTRVGDQELSSPLPSVPDIRNHAYELSETARRPSEFDPDYQRFLRIRSRLSGIPLLKTVVRTIRAILG